MHGRHTKYLMAGVTLLAGLVPASAMAAGTSTISATRLYSASGLAQVHRGASPSLRSGAQNSLRPMARTAARTHDVTVATGVMSPWDKWPAGTTNEKGNVADTTQLDLQTYNAFVLFHSVKYADSHVVGGYVQTASVPITTATGAATALGYWLGTYYSTADAAVARVTDAVNALKASKVVGVPCFATWTACHLFTLTLKSQTGTSLSAVYMVYSEGNAVGEAMLVSHANALTDGAAAHSLGVAIGEISAGADKSILAVLAAPTVAIDTVFLQHLVKKVLVTTASLKSNEQGVLVATFHTTNAGAQLPTGTVVVTKSGKTLISGPLRAIPNGPNQIVLAAVANFKVTGKKTSHLVATFKVVLGSSTATKTMPFSVKPKKK